MSSEKAIENILREQVKSYRVLHDLLNKERTCLLKIDAEKVEAISKEKDTVVMRLRLLEEERQRLMRTFTEDRGMSGIINLEELSGLSGNDEFVELRSELRSLLRDIEEMNQINSILIDRSLKYIRTTANFFGSFAPENGMKNTGVLLSKET